ncbi:MAG: hypothetical protein ACOX4Q_10970 [Syntrophomonadales bacterium]
MNLTAEVYELISTLPRYNYLTPPHILPANGICLFFEAGETCVLNDRQVDRIVHIGANQRNGRLPGRIQDHYGRVNSLGGNKNASIFRKHIGGALLNRADPHDTRIEDWIKLEGPTLADVEEWVSRKLRDRFSFICLPLESTEERQSLKKGLIALMAQHPLGHPSERWLGHYALNPDISSSGLWNTQHIWSDPLTLSQFKVIERNVY